MAYPTVSAPYGLVPVKLVTGAPYIGVTRQYKIASGYATNIFKGDLVKIHTDGTIVRETADAAVDTIGVFMGCSYTDSTFGKVFRQYYPADTVASDIQAYVVDDPDVLFKVAVISSAASTTPIVMADLAQADVGRNLTMVDNAGDTATGNSKVAVDDTSYNFPCLAAYIIKLPATLTSTI
jgi:hypothetical protein